MSQDNSPRWLPAAEVGLIFLVLFIQGAWPVPAANEPHYLGKARHYWDPSWCAGDFFLDTADAHLVFCWAFGWLALVWPLPVMAWCGRVLVWGLLAWAWRRLSCVLVPAPLYAVLSAAILVTLNDRCQMAGEWLVGGVEGKGFAYVLVLLALGSLARGRWTSTWLLLGTASSFHVIVGGWSVVAAMVAWMASPDRPTLRRTILPLTGGLLLALPGLLSAIMLTWQVDPRTVAEANRVYVFERLNHHLVPQRFPPWFVVRHLLLVAALVVLVQFAGNDEPWRRLRAFVAATLGIAAVGMVIGLLAPAAPDLAAALLRYYWFRLSDVMVPLGVALAVVLILYRWQATAPARHAVALVAVLAAVIAHFGGILWVRHESGVPPADAWMVTIAARRNSGARRAHVAAAIRADWQEVCRWAADETPPGTRFITPLESHTFRWYANRAEVVSRKDLPQDAVGIVEWWRRLQRVHLAGAGSAAPYWRRSLTDLDPGDLRDLGQEFGAEYVMAPADPPLALPRVGPRTASFAVYRLSDGSQNSLQESPTTR